MNHYTAYLAERLGHSTIVRDEGFISYKIVDSECFLSDMFVEKTARGTGIGKHMLSELVGIAKENGCKAITANIFTHDKNANETLKSAIACGFELKGSGVNVLLIALSIGGN